MADYTPLLTRAITGQDEAARAGIYARAREALERQLRSFEPKLTDEQIEAELAGLNVAIETVEAGARAAQAPLVVEETASQQPEATPETASAPVEPPEAAGIEAEQPAVQEPAVQEPAAERPATAAEPSSVKTAQEASAETSVAVATVLPLQSPALQSPAPQSPDKFERSLTPDEAEVLKAANTDEVSAPPLVEPLIPTARPRMPLRDEARTSRRPMRMAVSAALVVILGMSALALSRRSAPDPLHARKGTLQDVASAEGSKTEGRLASEAPARPSETTAPVTGNGAGSESTLSTSTRAFMVLESPGNAPSQFEGRALWSFEPDAAAKGEKTLRTIIAFPGADLTIDLSLSRNKDAALGASHLMMAIFDVPKGFDPVREMSPIEWREREAQAGSVYRGSVVPVQDNAFMVTLDKAAEAANIALLKSQKWMVFEFRLANGRRGAALLEKGSSGEKAAEEALKTWK